MVSKVFEVMNHEQKKRRGKKDSRVHNRWENTDTHVAHADDIRRRRGGRAASLPHNNCCQPRVTSRAHDSNRQRPADEEDTEADIDRLESVLDVDTRASSLGGDHGDILGADNGKGGRPQRPKKAFKATQSTGVKILHKSPGVVPVAESVGFTLRVSADHGDKGEEEERENQDDLATGEPELGFTVGANRQNVQEADRETFVS